MEEWKNGRMEEWKNERIKEGGNKRMKIWIFIEMVSRFWCE
jgi:hypothetical protein